MFLLEVSLYGLNVFFISIWVHVRLVSQLVILSQTHIFAAVKAYSFDVGESSSESDIGGSKLMRQLPIPSPATTGPYFPPRPVHDLISLVEKGKVGISSNSSCCSSTTSSVGDRHGIPATKIVSQGNDSIPQQRYNRLGQFSFRFKTVELF